MSNESELRWRLANFVSKGLCLSDVLKMAAPLLKESKAEHFINGVGTVPASLVVPLITPVSTEFLRDELRRRGYSVTLGEPRAKGVTHPVYVGGGGADGGGFSGDGDYGD